MGQNCSALSRELHKKRTDTSLDLSKRDFKVVPKRVKVCKCVVELNLTNNNLTEFVTYFNDRITNIETMKHLEVIDFSNNAVNCFPTLPPTIEKVYASHNRLFYSPISPDIAMLVNLVFLDISFNQLEEIPDALGLVKSLKNLQAHDNALSETPSALYSLPKLQTLNLSRNKIKIIPPEFATAMANLKGLNMQFNAITKLPDNLGAMSSLVYLDFDENLIKKIPESIGDMEYMQVLKLGNNPIDELPWTISKLPMLKALDLRTTRIASVPSSFRKLSALEEIVLQGNLQVIAFPDFFEFTTGIKRIDSSNCSLTSIPGFIGNLVNLTSLDLRKNQLSSYAIPPNIRDLKSLTHLYLGSNNLEALPDEICEISTLLELDLSNNLIIILPDDIGNLVKLDKLFINSNKLEFIPTSLGSLYNLTVLELRNNILTSLPPELGTLEKLQKLDLSKNKLSELPCDLYLLRNLLYVDLGDNSPPQQIITQGVHAILDYLQNEYEALSEKDKRRKAPPKPAKAVRQYQTMTKGF